MAIIGMIWQFIGRSIRMIKMNVCIIAGKKSASWQLVAVVIGPETTKRREIAKTSLKSKEKISLTASVIFWLPSLLNLFLPGMICIYIYRHRKKGVIVLLNPSFHPAILTFTS